MFIVPKRMHVVHSQHFKLFLNRKKTPSGSQHDACHHPIRKLSASVPSKHFFGKENAKVTEIHTPQQEARSLYTLIDANVSNKMEMGVEKVEAGAQIPWHSHKISEEIIFIISGCVKATVGNEEKLMKAGDTAFIPPNTKHRFVNTSAVEPVWLTFTSSPPISLSSTLQGVPGADGTQYKE